MHSQRQHSKENGMMVHVKDIKQEKCDLCGIACVAALIDRLEGVDISQTHLSMPQHGLLKTDSQGKRFVAPGDLKPFFEGRGLVAMHVARPDLERVHAMVNDGWYAMLEKVLGPSQWHLVVCDGFEGEGLSVMDPWYGAHQILPGDGSIVFNQAVFVRPTECARLGMLCCERSGPHRVVGQPASQAYHVKAPRVDLCLYWPEGVVLLLAYVAPIVTCAVWHTGAMVSRSGSITVFFAAVAEFIMLGRMNKKHILNACRVKAKEVPWGFSLPAKAVGLLSLFAGLGGTIIWGYGDLLFGK
jgi:hypothetical protein